MGRWFLKRLYLIGIAFLLLGLLAACAQPAPAVTPPSVTVLEQATATPAPTSTPDPAPEPTNTPAPDLSLPTDWVVLAVDEGRLRIHHPAAWEMTQPTPANMADLFAQATDDESKFVQVTLRQLTATPGALDAFVLLGFLFDDPSVADNRYVSNITGLLVPAEGLTLATYGDLVGAQLGNAEGVSVQSVEVRGGLRPGGLDVASLRYSMDGVALYGLAEGTRIEGWQAALYDASGERLLILSLTSVAENFPPLAEMFQRLLYNVEFE